MDVFVFFVLFFGKSYGHLAQRCWRAARGEWFIKHVFKQRTKLRGKNYFFYSELNPTSPGVLLVLRDLIASCRWKFFAAEIVGRVGAQREKMICERFLMWFSGLISKFINVMTGFHKQVSGSVSGVEIVFCLRSEPVFAKRGLIFYFCSGSRDIL